MSTAATRLAVQPTARAMPWSPVVIVAAFGSVTAWLSGALGDRPTAIPVVVAGALAASGVSALRDPAAELLAALPTAAMTRRLLRTAWVLLAVVPATSVVAWLTPGPGAVSSTLALLATGVAVATWTSDRHVLAAAAVPAAWTSAGLVLEDRLGLVGDLSTWWSTHPWQVVVLATAALVIGRNR